ncbi:hypothetical protein F5I97DRAFT_1850553 [Phlebopus sp. FC_14]|nr:hypothetical protein F5I97DRAFT_1850553 [Phlebopus sp. FC_14]
MSQPSPHSLDPVPPMDSEITLVNPGPPTPYFLSSSDLRDAVIYAQPAIPLYRITSDSKYIRINDGLAPGRIIAILHRRELLPNTVSFPGRGKGTPLNLQKWLRKTKSSHGGISYVMNTEYGTCIWKVVSAHHQKVFADYDTEKPLASCCLHQNLPQGKPAFILENIAEPLRDEIVVGYLVQRHRVMMEDVAIDLFG